MTRTDHDSFDTLPPLVPPEGPSEATRLAIRRMVVANLAPVNALSVRKRVLFVLAAGLATAVLVVVSYGAFGLKGLTRHLVASVVCVAVAGFAALAMGGSFTPKMQRLLGGSNRILLLGTLLVGWSLYLVAGLTDDTLASALSGAAFGCALRSVAAGALGAAAFFWIWRKTDPWTPRLSGALIGACAGAIASAGVGIPCPPDAGGHVLVGHWFAVPLLAVLGALLAPRVLSP